RFPRSNFSAARSSRNGGNSTVVSCVTREAIMPLEATHHRKHGLPEQAAGVTRAVANFRKISDSFQNAPAENTHLKGHAASDSKGRNNVQPKGGTMFSLKTYLLAGVVGSQSRRCAHSRKTRAASRSRLAGGMHRRTSCWSWRRTARPSSSPP